MIQTIIQIMAQVLFFWRRDAKGDVEAAFSLKDQVQACRAYARAAGYKVVSSFRERRDGKGPRRPQFEKLLQAARNGQVDVVYVYDAARLSREPRMDRRDECGGPPRRCSATEQVVESSEFRAFCEGVSQPITEHSGSELPVAIYCRDATHRPEESTLDAQVAAVVEQAEADGERVDPIYIYQDLGSGLALDRPGLGQLCRVVLDGKVRAVYADKPHRLSRHFPHLVALKATFASAGVELRYVRRPVTGTRSPSRDCNDRVDSSEPREVKDELFTAIQLVFDLSNAGWDMGSIAALLNEMGFMSEDS